MLPKKFNLLRIKSADAVRRYKSNLYETSIASRSFTKTFQAEFVKSLLSNSSTYAIFLQVSFLKDSLALSLFLESLKADKISYVLITPEAFKGSVSLSDKQWLPAYINRGLVLVIDAKNSSCYHKLLVSLLRMEKDSLSEVFNQFALLFTKEATNLISFKAEDQRLRELYIINSDKSAILLEILSAVGQPAVSLTRTLENGVSAFGMVQYSSFLPVFPFK